MSRIRRSAAALAAAAALAMVTPVAASAQPLPSQAGQSVRPMGVAYCSTWTSDGRAYAYCNIKSGQARVRADCAWFPDLYSPWEGKGYWTMWTGKCPWGIRGAIMEYR